MDFIKKVTIGRTFLIINFMFTISYFIVLAFFFPIGNILLFCLLIIASLFHLWQAMGYIHSVWPRKVKRSFNASYKPEVAIFITVTGEPTEIVERTLKSALAMNYPDFNVYILNDGLVAGRDNWQEAEELANEYGVRCITRTQAGGAKAGNINNALKLTKEHFIVVFDADHVPKKRFLKSTMGYFKDRHVGFVQSPQYYSNHKQNVVTMGAWEQQALFFGAILKGKDTLNSTFMCGTNMVIRRKALDEVGGMSEESIAEDFLTSLLIHEKKWKSVYVPTVLAEGLAPEDFLSYYKQQFRWARGSLEIVFRYNPFARRGLTMAQRVQYLSSASFYLSGFVVVLNATLPLIYFFFGITALTINTMTLALIFIPYILIVLYTIQLTSNFTYTFRALSFSLSSFPIHLKAVFQILTGKKSGFVVTSKKALSGNHGYLSLPHITYVAVVIGGVVVGVMREGFSPSLLSNLAWATVYIAIFMPFIAASFYKAKPAIIPEKKALKMTQVKETAT